MIFLLCYDILLVFLYRAVVVVVDVFSHHFSLARANYTGPSRLYEELRS